ncbi:MAG: hypothetical protein KC583_00520, partial [Myxococcales bacterium]|nr:hypothetical protein [Myxococcales bacterium]
AHRCRGGALALLFWAGLGFCVVGSLAQVVSGSNALGLLFPWRMSAVLVPAATAILWGGAVRWLRGTRAARRSPVVAGALMISVLCFGVFWTWRQWGKPVDQAREPAYQLVARTVSHDLPGQRWWVPSDFEAFRLATRRAVWCDLKSHPYDPVHVIAWWRCMEQDEALQRGALTCADAYAVARVAGVTHVLVRRDVADRLACPPAELEQVATSDAFVILGVKREQP